MPHWEELILFNENFDYLKGFGDKFGLFFLVQDFVSMTRTNNQKETEKVIILVKIASPITS